MKIASKIFFLSRIDEKKKLGYAQLHAWSSLKVSWAQIDFRSVYYAKTHFLATKLHICWAEQ